MYRITILLFALVGCAATPVTRIPRVDPGQVDAIHVEIDAAQARFDRSAALRSAGELEAAQAEHEAARVALSEGAERCVATPGCDVRRALAAQDSVLAALGPGIASQVDDTSAAADTPVMAGEGDSPLLRIAPEAARTVSLFNGRDLAEAIALNEPVKAALEEWLTWMRPQLLDTWENYQYMRYLMFPAYERSGLPEALLFGILAKESNAKVHAVSRAGAAGPLQFMPETGARFGLNRGGPFDLRFDPQESARASGEYLNERFAQLNHNLALALAAYNGGEGRLSRLSNGGERDFWSPAVFDALPLETRDYVPMVLAAAWLFLHPERYQLQFPTFDTRSARVTLAEPTSLNEVAVCLGQEGNPRGWFRHLRNLNPRWDPTRRIDAGTELRVPQVALDAWQRHCRSGERLAMSRELHDARPPERPPGSGRRGRYVVKRGDSLHSIARSRGCSVRELAHANGIQAPRYLIRAGQTLRLEGCGSG